MPCDRRWDAGRRGGRRPCLAAGESIRRGDDDRGVATDRGEQYREHRILHADGALDDLAVPVDVAYVHPGPRRRAAAEELALHVGEQRIADRHELGWSGPCEMS